MFVCVDKHWPLSYHLCFDLLAIGAIGGATMTLLLHSSIEQKRENETDPINLTPNGSTKYTECVSEQQWVYAQSECIEQILIGFILLYRNLHNIFI